MISTNGIGFGISVVLTSSLGTFGTDAHIFKPDSLEKFVREGIYLAQGLSPSFGPLVLPPSHRRRRPAHFGNSFVFQVADGLEKHATNEDECGFLHFHVWFRL